MTKTYSVHVAEDFEADTVLNFVRNYYYKEEPLTKAHPEPGHTKDDEAFTMSQLKYKSVLIATDDDNGNVAGVIVAGPIFPGDAERMIEAAKTTETKKWSDISLFLAYIEKKADVLRRFKQPKALHVHALGVHHDYRGQGIGELLFRACFDNAKKLKIALVTADCTSIYSIKIAERLGMENISNVTYDEYHEVIGDKLFTPTEPNTMIKTYLKRV